MELKLSCLILSTFICGSLASDSLRFLVLGDMGGLSFFPYTTPAQVATSYQLAKHAEKTKAEFILALGDNFYFSGVTNVKDSRFKETFENIYHHHSLQLPWHLIAGNHDHRGNVSAEILYSQISKRWNFPNYYYPLAYKIPGTELSVHILMLDTILLCGQSDSDFLYSQPRNPSNPKAAEEQWAWLEQSLANSNSSYLIVAGHFPVYSVAEHGPTSCLVDRLLPMLYKYRVSVYMCGHDHSLQHLQETKDGVTVDFFLSGASNFLDPSTAHAANVPEGVSKFDWGPTMSLGGFGYVDINSDNMTFSFIEATGTILHTATVLPRKV